MRDVVKLMRSDLINRNVTVDTELAQNLPAVTGDRVQLQQVLLNLMLNGCDAMADHDSSRAPTPHRFSIGERRSAWYPLPIVVAAFR